MKPSVTEGARQVKAFWKRFSADEQHQLVGACCAVIAIFYGLLVWYPGNKTLDELKYQEGKLNLRKKATSGAGGPSIKLEGINIQATQKDLGQVSATLARQEAELARLTARFIPLDDLESMQMLKSELARLAESGDMEVTALEHIYRRSSDRDRPPNQELLKESAQASPYRRPLLSLKARASYRGLMQFLDGLDKLTFVAAPVWSDIQVRMADTRRSGDTSGTAPAPKQWLEVEIRLAV
ncbi:MAG: type II secretion system protein M [Zoogloeaceae bacterium]|jgi:hypothetical protein|nr:type II secretion system protein M [Zoogloeaceae bacterium]